MYIYIYIYIYKYILFMLCKVVLCLFNILRTTKIKNDYHMHKTECIPYVKFITFTCVCVLINICNIFKYSVLSSVYIQRIEGKSYIF